MEARRKRAAAATAGAVAECGATVTLDARFSRNLIFNASLGHVMDRRISQVRILQPVKIHRIVCLWLNFSLI